MGLKSDFDPAKNLQEFRDFEEQIRERIRAALHYAGEDFIINSRSQPGDHSKGFYEDKTGNLRNSIGYFIFEDGQLIESSGLPDEFRILAEELVEKTGFQLIGIAGMNYASYVEAKGFNVISQQAEACIVLLEEFIGDIRKFAENEP